MTLARVKVSYFNVYCEIWTECKEATFCQLFHLLDIVHFDGLRIHLKKWIVTFILIYVIHLDCHVHGYETLHAI